MPHSNKLSLFAALAIALGGVALLAGVRLLLDPHTGTEPTAPPATTTAAPITPAPTRGTPGETLIGYNAAARTKTQSPDAAPAVQETPSPPRVTVWWPDELYPAESSEAAEIFERQIEGYRETYEGYTLDIRRKRSAGLGGILPMLRTAHAVAPSALPDLALMRRADMVTAAAEGLLVPIREWVPLDILENNLLPGAQALGEIGGQLYGVPYALTVTHTIYRTSVYDAPLLTFSDVLLEGPDYLFPAGTAPGTTVNRTLLLQYLQAGGRLADANGNPVLDRTALIAVLQYYASGVTQGMFAPTLLDYTQPDSYWNLFVSGDATMIGTDSSIYLSRRADLQNVGLAPIPTVNGTPTTELNGWMWVLITQDPEQQERARAFLSWMMRISQQGAFSEALSILPSQQRALLLWEDQAYAEFTADLIANGRIVDTAQRTNTAAAALQQSLADVLNGADPETAADDALTSLIG